MTSTRALRSLARCLALPLGAFLVPSLTGPAAAGCPEMNLFHFTGPGEVVCPCFVEGEEAGVQFTLPPGDFPIEIIRVGIAWGSQFGGAPTTLEQAIHFYEGGIPNPGLPIFSLGGPQLTDGFINEFDLEAVNSTVTVNSSPFMVTLEFLNANAGSFFDPSVVHDGNGCQAGKNVIYAIPGGWLDVCGEGLTGDWVMFIVYRQVCDTGVTEERMVASSPIALLPPQPNPTTGDTRVSFFVERERPVRLDVFDLQGRRVTGLADRSFPAGSHSMTWNGRRADGSVAANGVYFLVLRSGDHRETRKVTLSR